MEIGLKIRKTGKGEEVFDPIRKKFVALTPEELVRQNFILMLSYQKEIPISLMRVEVGLKLNKLQKRCDILIYNKLLSPIMMVECKAPSVKITQSAFDQIARYNLVFRVPYLVATNGNKTYCCKLDFETNSYAFLPEIPLYNRL